MVDTATTVKKTTRTRKTSASAESVSSVKPSVSQTKTLKVYDQAFSDLLKAINVSKEEFVDLQKDMDELRESWNKEQRNHEIAVMERSRQEETGRKRENETYAYEINRIRKQEEDEFREKKAKWERELQDRKDEIAREKQELEMLRKQVEGFETEKERAVKEASQALQKQLQETFTTERKIREQEVKAEKELLALRITNLTQDNARQTSEIITLKKALEDATRQLKEVAVKVIESSNTSQKIPLVTNG